MLKLNWNEVPPRVCASLPAFVDTNRLNLKKVADLTLWAADLARVDAVVARCNSKSLSPNQSLQGISEVEINCGHSDLGKRKELPWDNEGSRYSHCTFIAQATFTIKGHGHSISLGSPNPVSPQGAPRQLPPPLPLTLHRPPQRLNGEEVKLSSCSTQSVEASEDEDDEEDRHPSQLQVSKLQKSIQMIRNPKTKVDPSDMDLEESIEKQYCNAADRQSFLKQERPAPAKEIKPLPSVKRDIGGIAPAVATHLSKPAPTIPSGLPKKIPVPASKPKPKVVDDESSDEDSSELPPKPVSSKHPQNGVPASKDKKMNIPDPADEFRSKQAHWGKNSTHSKPEKEEKYRLDLSSLHPKVESVELPLSRVRQLHDDEFNTLFSSGTNLQYKALQLDESTMQPRIASEFQNAQVISCRGRNLSLLNLPPLGLDTSQHDDLHLDSIYDIRMTPSQLSAQQKSVLSRLTQPTESQSVPVPVESKPDREQREMEEHKDKYRSMAAVDNSMNELEKAIAHQVNYYFGDKNYFQDKFIQNHINHDGEKAMDTAVLLNFNKIKNMTTDPAVVLQALRKFEPSQMCTYSLIGHKIHKKSLPRPGY